MPNTIKPTGLDTTTGQGKTGEAGDSLEISFIRLPGSSSGVVTISTAAAAGTHTIKLPTADGSAAQVLTTDGAGQWSWSTPAGTGANTDLSNLAAVAINASLIAGSAGTLDLGSGALPWREIFFSGTSGTPATNGFKFTGASTGGLRTLTVPNASGTLALTSDLSAYIPTSYLDTDPTLAANSNSKIATQAATKAYADQLIASANALVYKGVIDCSTNPNYPAADTGWLYVVSVAGKIGGASGINVEVGDFIICNTDGTVSGDQATVGAFWNIIQKNLDGAVIGPTSAVDNRIAAFDGATGKLIKDGGILTSSLALTSNKLNVFAATTSAELAGVISDETGTGALVFANTPTLVTPVLGVATATSINKVAITAPATSATLTIADGATLTASASATVSGTNTGDQDIFKTVASQSGSTTANTTTDTITINGANGNTTAVSGDTLTITGGGASTWTGNQTVGENLIILDPALSADGTFSGTAEDGTAGATLAFGDLCQYSNADSRWELADISAAIDAVGDCRGKIGMCILAAAGDGSATRMLLWGKIRADARFPAMTVNRQMFASTTAGDITGTQPSTSGDVFRAIGFANTADELFFCPSTDYDEVA